MELELVLRCLRGRTMRGQSLVMLLLAGNVRAVMGADICEQPTDCVPRARRLTIRQRDFSVVGGWVMFGWWLLGIDCVVRFSF